MKIGLAAVTYKDNFGSALQTYATQYVLEKLGHKVGIFEIRGVHRSIKVRKMLYYLGRLFDPIEARYLITNLRSRTRKCLSAPSDQYAENMKIRHQMYIGFNKKWLKMLPYANGWGVLKRQAKAMEAVVVGSDQLWRPSNIVGRFFTLEFVPDEIKKVAFSTSFGVPELPARLHNHTKRFLSRMDHISVREESGAAIVKNESGRDAQVVCDPTMLLSAKEWLHIQDVKPFAGGDYILCYFMGNNPEHRTFAKRLKEKTGYRIVGLLHGATYIASDEAFADETPYHVGPSEFVNLIRCAKFVCTDSFHGVVFSILNKKEFFSFRRWPDGSQFSSNDRLYTLLKHSGLENRMLFGNEDIDKSLSTVIDYDKVLARILQLRASSLDFLTNALSS